MVTCECSRLVRTTSSSSMWQLLFTWIHPRTLDSSLSVHRRHVLRLRCGRTCPVVLLEEPASCRSPTPPRARGPSPYRNPSRTVHDRKTYGDGGRTGPHSSTLVGAQGRLRTLPFLSNTCKIAHLLLQWPLTTEPTRVVSVQPPRPSASVTVLLFRPPSAEGPGEGDTRHSW